MICLVISLAKDKDYTLRQEQEETVSKTSSLFQESSRVSFWI